MEISVQPLVKNSPLPEMKRRGAKPKYPWDTIQPGDAFKFEPDVTMSGATSLAYATGKQRKMKFAVRRVGEEIWCWRIDGTPYNAKNGNYRQTMEVVQNYGATAQVADETDIVGEEDAI